MRVDQVARAMVKLPAFASALNDKSDTIRWDFVCSEAAPLLLAARYLAAPRKVLILTPTYEKALAWQAKLTLCGVPESQIRQLPSGLSALFEDASPETFAISERIGALKFLIEEGPGLVIATPQSALERTLPRECLEESFVVLRPGETIDAQQLIRTLSRLGYEPSEPARIPGQFSQRGGILDIFATGQMTPVRIEMFGDEIESMRGFDPNTQRSTGPVLSLTLGPSRETLLPPHETDYSDMLHRTLDFEESALGPAEAEHLRLMIEADIQALEGRVFFDRLDLYRPMIHPESGCAIDLAEDALIVLDEPSDLDGIGARSGDELGQSLQARADRGEILSSTAHDFLLPPEHLANSRRLLAISAHGSAPDWLHTESHHELQVTSLESYRHDGRMLAQQLQRWSKEGRCIVIGTDQPTRAAAMLQQIGTFGGDESEFSGETLPSGTFLVRGNLAGGFHMIDGPLVLLTDQELFGVGRLRLPQKRFNEGLPVTTILDLKPGDYVVHINYGIGIFRGLTKRTVAGIEKEFLFIEYQSPDKLFVPADQLDRIQKYLNPGDAEPKLNRLTGGEWQKTVGKARAEAREFARDLIKLYAARKKVERPSYGPDSPWQSEMEATFPWVETPSQLKAIQETKFDLTLNYPMDRLICGDVGFGKTEVSIRAAFKVAQTGRQVAVLCPTTILSEQHYRNFYERLSPSGVRLELLNRFRSASERKTILESLAKGEIDVLIGTHALLGKDLKFKDLGLVVIDEEQKFGVKQKETLKSLRVSVDILTMSATPIPRTLSMALMDIRQMSLINDPPPGRLPIRTFVRAYSDEITREALLRELARGGQAYYVYNRVQGIYHIAEKVRKLVPNARVGVGHGQMSEHELEPIMIAFIKGEIDVLVSTSIVESGLDIPNANTMIVEHADRMGLAQLYQLRGRVGRSDRQAYAYLLYQSNRELTDDAMSRLKSLQEFSSLGSGYSLAFRDLQIRGAGELLGARQHGAMATVGYELYSQLIGEEVKFLKAHADGVSEAGEVTYTDPLEGLQPLPSLDLPVSAFIPDEYVTEEGQRLYCYKQLMAAREEKELDATQEEIRDRYGPMPQEVLNAFSVMRLRLHSRDLSIEKIDGNGGRLLVSFFADAEVSPRVFTLMGKENRECYVSRSGFVWPYAGNPIDATRKMLQGMSRVIAQIERDREAFSNG